MKELEADPQHSFPGQGNMKPEQLEIERLRREVQSMKVIAFFQRGLLSPSLGASRRRRRCLVRPRQSF
jgi:hypothetical protein